MVAAVNTLIRDALDRSPRGTRARLADATGVSPSTVTRWARDSEPDPEHWHDIEQLLGLRSGSIRRAIRQRADDTSQGDVLHELRELVGEIRRLADRVAALEDQSDP